MIRVLKSAFVASGFLAVCALSAPSSWGQSAGNLRVGLSVTGEPHYVPLWVARELGYFTQAGVEVDLQYQGGGGLALAALREGRADAIVLSPISAGQSFVKGEKLLCFAGRGSSANGWHFLVPATSTIRGFADLAGKRIGITGSGGSSSFYSMWAARQGGATIEMVPLGGSVPAALADGRVDAAPVWPNEAARLIASGQARSIANLAQVLPPHMPACWAAKQETIETRAAALRGFVDGVSRGIARLQADEAFALQKIRQVTGETDPQLVAASFRDIIMRMPVDMALSEAAIANSFEMARAAQVGDLPSPGDILSRAFTPVPPRR